MEQLIKIFQEIGHMPPGSEHLLLEITDRKELPAKSSLQETGKVCNHIYFVEKRGSPHLLLQRFEGGNLLDRSRE